MKVESLTKRQFQVLVFLVFFYKEYDRIPTTRAIANHFGFVQTAAVSFLRTLERKGVLEKVEINRSKFYRFDRTIKREWVDDGPNRNLLLESAEVLWRKNKADPLHANL